MSGIGPASAWNTDFEKGVLDHGDKSTHSHRIERVVGCQGSRWDR